MSCKLWYVFLPVLKVKIRLQNTQPLVTDGVSHCTAFHCISLHFTAFHLHFSAGISFFMQFFILLNSFCFLPLQDGDKERLSDVDDLGN